jgi:2-dehydropantoate 2-reductase
LINGEQRLSSNPIVWTNPLEASLVDWVLVTTKVYDVAGAAVWLPKLRGPETPVAVLQNGVEHRARFAPFVDPSRVVPVMVDCPAERDAPGQIRQRGPAKMITEDSVQGRAFAELFLGSEISVTLTSDMNSALWRKLCLNCAGVISALVLKPAGIMRDDRVGELARSLVRECIAVGRAEGADLDDSLVETVLAGYRAAPVDAVNSLHADRAAGRRTEIDARNGVIVRLGLKHGIATPYNSMAVTLLEASAS